MVGTRPTAPRRSQRSTAAPPRERESLFWSLPEHLLLTKPAGGWWGECCEELGQGDLAPRLSGLWPRRLRLASRGPWAMCPSTGCSASRGGWWRHGPAMGAPSGTWGETPPPCSQTHKAGTWRLPDAQTLPTPAPSLTAQIVPGLGEALGKHSYHLGGPEAVGYMVGFSCLLAILSCVLAGFTSEWPPQGFGGLGTSELAS